jgi:hypothetical protein
VVDERVLKLYWVPRKRTELEAVQNVIIRIFIFLLFTLCCFDGVRVEMSETSRRMQLRRKDSRLLRRSEVERRVDEKEH